MNETPPSPAELVGLTASEASRRLSEAGPNEIRRGRAGPAWLILASQFKSPVIGVLIAACVVSAALGELVDAVAIATIVVLNGLVGFFQEYRAEKAVLALRAMTAPRARVRRDGHQLMVPAAEVVVGDLLLLEAGDIVAADSRLVETHALMIASLLETAGDTQTSLQHRLAVVSRSLLYICLGIVAVTAVIGLLRGMGLLDVSLSAVSLAVAAVPEGLPAIVTIVTLLELWKLARRGGGRAAALSLGAAAFLLTLLGSRPALAADPGLNAFVAEVLAQNPGLKARTLERESVLREASAAGLFPDPEVAIMVDRLPERMGGEMPMVRYQLSQMLPWPGKLGLMDDALKRRADGKAALARAKQVDLVREAKRAYLMLALNAGLRQVNKASHDLLTMVAKAALARYGAGVGGHHEVVRAEVERNALDIEALDLEGDRVSTIAMLNALRNTAADLPFPDPPLPAATAKTRLPTITELMRLAEARRSELAAMRSMQHEESTMAALSRRERYPDFMTSVWYNQMLGAADTVGVMVGASIPIFNVRRQNRRAEAAELRASSAGSDLAAMRAMIRFEVADALRRLDTANRSLDLIVDIAAPRAAQSFSSSLSSYSTAAIDIVGVLEAWRALQSVERARVETLIARALAVADIEHAIAGPLQKASP